MTHVLNSIHFRYRLLSALTFVLLIGPAAAQDRTVSVSAPLTAVELMARVVQMNEVRAKALATYSSVRTYHLECHGLCERKADMVVRADFVSPDKKKFSIVSESGSGTVRKKVFRKLLEAEQESMKDDNQRRSAITPQNYTFRLVKYEKTAEGETYVVAAEPRTKNKFLFSGRIWVDARDFAVIRVEGQPAVNPSWWTRRTDFTRTYQKVGEFWLPGSNESVTKLRLLGTAELTIKYGDYRVTQAPAATVASSQAEPQNQESKTDLED
jgi:hypothetical protein